MSYRSNEGTNVNEHINVTKAQFKHKYKYLNVSKRIYLYTPCDGSIPLWRPPLKQWAVTSELSYKEATLVAMWREKS